MTPDADEKERKRGPVRRVLRWALVVFGAAGLFAGGYFGTAELAMRFPVRPDIEPEEGPIRLFLSSNGVHVDVFVPVRNEVRDWSERLAPAIDLPRNGYIAVGWGDRAFYLEVPTWDDLDALTAIRGAFLPTPSAVRVRWFSGPLNLTEHVHEIWVDDAAYARLVDYLDDAFDEGTDGAPQHLTTVTGANGDKAHYFEGRRPYHMFRTCNVWTNGAVRALGRTAPFWAPFERNVRRHLLPPGKR